MANIEIRNESNREFVDISAEKSRSYLYPGGAQLTIDFPQWFHLSDSGNAYILDIKGRMFVVAPGWQILSWEVHNDKPHIEF